MPENMPMSANEPALIPKTEQEPRTSEEPVSETAPTMVQSGIEPGTLIRRRNFTEEAIREEISEIPETERMPPSFEEDIPSTLRSVPSEPVNESGVRSISGNIQTQSEAVQEDITIIGKGNNPVPPDMSKPPHVASILDPDNEQAALSEKQERVA